MAWISTDYVLRHIPGNPRATLSVPPDPSLDETKVRHALREVMQADGLMNHLVRHLPEHGSHDIKIKLSAISAFASAKIVQFEKISAAMESWAKEHNTPIPELIDRGDPKQASRMMNHVAMKVGRKQTSALSKYLAYHSSRWPIYDGWVRNYLWANLLHIDSAKIAPEPGWAGLASATDLKQYDKYCSALNAVWERMGLPQNLTPRERDAVFWYRASRGKITVSINKRGKGRITGHRQLRAP